MYVIATATYPISAKKEMRFRYHIKSILSIPITATPAAEPMIRTDPPVPAQ